MKLLKIDLEEDLQAPDGLGKIQMDRMGQVVVVAGPNGAGKSRLLKRVQAARKRILAQIQIRQMQENNVGLEASIKTHPDHSAASGWRQALESNKNSLAQHNSLRIDRQFNTQNDIPRFLEFMPVSLSLSDCNDFTKNQLSQHAAQIRDRGFASFQKGTLAAIQDIQNKYWNVTHQSYRKDDPAREAVIQNYDRLKNHVSVFLGTDLARNSDENATLFGRKLGDARLSNGQIILLQFCLALYAQGTDLNGLVLFMDEPENHLHPAALIDTINKIIAANTDGQLWIATHSVPLLASFDPASIWFMDRGLVKYAGRTPRTVLEGLLGGEDGVDRMGDFLGLPAQFAANQFAAECLLPPTTVEAGEDPQNNQISEILIQKEQKNLRILDFGAGKGRLLSHLAETFSPNGASLNFSTLINYFAFEPASENFESCKKTITSIYGEGPARCFESYASLLSHCDKESFDAIVMCNVLHEIDPGKWIEVFSADGPIYSLLKPSGVVLIVEDYRMPKGECAHSKGFLVLDRGQLKSLFKIKENEIGFKGHDARGDGRLKAHVVPREMILRIDSASRGAAIQSLIETGIEEIRRLRGIPPNYKNGVLHAFWVQQLANAELARREYGG